MEKLFELTLSLNRRCCKTSRWYFFLLLFFWFISLEFRLNIVQQITRIEQPLKNTKSCWVHLLWLFFVRSFFYIFFSFQICYNLPSFLFWFYHSLLIRPWKLASDISWCAKNDRILCFVNIFFLFCIVPTSGFQKVYSTDDFYFQN